MNDRQPRDLHPVLKYQVAQVARERATAERELLEIMTAQAELFTVDTRGHTNRVDVRQVRMEKLICADRARETNINELVALKEGFLQRNPLPAKAHHTKLRALRATSCLFCDDLARHPEREILYTIDGYTLAADTPCPIAAGPHSVTIDIPSGELAIGRDFRECFPPPEARWGESILEERRAADERAKQGYVLAVTGDLLYMTRTENGELLVGKTIGYRDEGTAIELPGEPVPESDAACDMGASHWWCFADGDKIPRDAKDINRMKVAPGRYTFVLHMIDRDWFVDPEVITEPRVMITIRPTNP